MPIHLVKVWAHDLGNVVLEIRRPTEVGSRPCLSNKQNKNEFGSTNIEKGF
jgi:hypothetical protein